MTDQDAEAEQGLLRAIGTRQLAANMINMVVGAGIFALPAVVFAQVGPAAFVAYLICALAIGLVFLCFAEIGSRVTTSGGAYAYVETAFGPFAGFLTSTILWFVFAVLSDAAIANVLYDSLATVLPELSGPMARVVFLVLIFGGLAAINIRGVRQGVRFAFVLTVIKLVPLILLIVVGLFRIDAENLQVSGDWPSIESLGATSLILFFAFGGAESALTPSGEIKNPSRTVPRAILIGIGGVFALYLCIQLVAQGVLGSELAEHQQAPLAATADRIFQGAGILLIVGASVSIFGTLSCDLLSSPRALFAAADNGHLPAVLARVHPKYRTPHVAIMVFAGLACSFAISGGFRTLAVASSSGLLLIYLACSLATLELRRRDLRMADRVFRIPGGPIVPIASCLVIAWLLSHVTLDEVNWLGAVLLVASLYYFCRRAFLRRS